MTLTSSNRRFSSFDTPSTGVISPTMASAKSWTMQIFSNRSLFIERSVIRKLNMDILRGYHLINIISTQLDSYYAQITCTCGLQHFLGGLYLITDKHMMLSFCGVIFLIRSEPWLTHPVRFRSFNFPITEKNFSAFDGSSDIMETDTKHKQSMRK